MNENPDSPNPWLSIPATDYEGHMGNDAVGQLQFLNQVFQELVEDCRPIDLAVLGCTTGNGFEHLAPDRVGRVIGIDINPAYLEIARERFGDRLSGLELICADLEDCALQPRSLDLVHAALVLEYIDPSLVIEKASAWLRPGGLFAAVLQLPYEKGGKVSETGYDSLKRLDPIMNLVDPDDLDRIARAYGLIKEKGDIKTLKSGKSFFVGIYRLEP